MSSKKLSLPLGGSSEQAKPTLSEVREIKANIPNAAAATWSRRQQQQQQQAEQVKELKSAEPSRDG